MLYCSVFVNENIYLFKKNSFLLQIRQLLRECNDEEGKTDATYIRKGLQEITIFLEENTRL